ncbi:hypothetical protein FHX06_007147 [Rhizobium sp. BK512]|uniref:hypothetical protein n=1 Tax=Rhizobium sp. BK512 TaxID=2587010 RepID=UPI0016199AA0|nr:hypothetical protein [Rhizobium sp. BK512]MBB3565774.1 hypothetical protein [Rhizobium sp. BK512]
MPRLPSLMGHDRSTIFSDARSGSSRDAANALKRAADTRILERYAPAHVIVTAEGDIVHYSPNTGRFR